VTIFAVRASHKGALDRLGRVPKGQLLLSVEAIG
jgi:hypothetical protein